MNAGYLVVFLIGVFGPSVVLLTLLVIGMWRREREEKRVKALQAEVAEQCDVFLTEYMKWCFAEGKQEAAEHIASTLDQPPEYRLRVAYRLAQKVVE